MSGSTLFSIYKDKAGEYRWRFRAANGEIVADSAEGYKDKRDCRSGIDIIKKDGPDATVVDVSEK